MPVWNFIRTLSGRGELIPEPSPSGSSSSSIKQDERRAREKKHVRETEEAVDLEHEPVRKEKKSRKGKGKGKEVRHNKLPSEERTSKSLADAQKENAERWREQREKKVSKNILFFWGILSIPVSFRGHLLIMGWLFRNMKRKIGMASLYIGRRDGLG